MLGCQKGCGEEGLRGQGEGEGWRVKCVRFWLANCLTIGAGEVGAQLGGSEGSGFGLAGPSWLPPQPLHGTESLEVRTGPPHCACSHLGLGGHLPDKLDTEGLLP